MAWTYLAESEDSQEPWRATSGHSPTAKSTHIAPAFFYLEWHRANSQVHQSGMTLEPCAEVLSAQGLTSFMEVSLAKTLAVLDLERVWKESEADYFSRSLGSLAKYDQGSCSWRTYQRSLFEEQNELLESFVAYGMTVDGVFYPLPTWERPTEETGGFCWPTPKAMDGERGSLWAMADYNRRTSRKSLQSEVAESYRGKMQWGNGQLNPEFVEWLMGYPIGWTALKL